MLEDIPRSKNNHGCQALLHRFDARALWNVEKITSEKTGFKVWGQKIHSLLIQFRFISNITCLYVNFGMPATNVKQK